MTADRREQVAEALMGQGFGLAERRHIAAALLPVVDAMCAEAAADAIRWAANDVHMAYGTRMDLHDRAAQLHPTREDT